MQQFKTWRWGAIAALLLMLGPSSLLAQKPVKVYILVGQSNMQGHAQIRTLEHVGMDNRTKPMLKQMQNADGSPRVCEDVWIAYLSSNGTKVGKLTTGFGASDDKLGPELMFGITMDQAIDGPVLIIKAAWGGKSLNTDFRPPSAGPYRFNEKQLEQIAKRNQDLNEIKQKRAEATGHYYRLMLEHVKQTLEQIDKIVPEYDAAEGYELAGFVWFQGWNDMVDSGTYPSRGQPGGYQQYSTVMADFIRDVRRDLNSPKLPFVIGVMGVNGPTSLYQPSQQRYKGIHQGFRDAMAAPAELPEFKGNVVAVLTEKYWDQQLSTLRARESSLRQQLKKMKQEQKLNRQQEQQAREKLWADEFTSEERQVMEKGVSNAEYHYLGSAKIMAQIGKGFAEAIMNLQDQP